MSAGNLLINGAFLANLWTRLEDESMPCPTDARTFAADRWSLRYAPSGGGEVRQARSRETPPGAETSLEIRGAPGVTADVYVGQTVEANEALHFQRELTGSAWFWASQAGCTVRLVISQANGPDVSISAAKAVPVAAWTLVEFGFDARGAAARDLRVEWVFPAKYLSRPTALIRFTGAALFAQEFTPRLTTVETMLARRFCQRQSAQTQNAIGRALVCNPHELHFQFTFPEMRAFPAITLPQENECLTVFSREGRPQAGFVYDVPHRARGAAIIRATKQDHGLSDGYLAFRGYGGSILLEAEL